MKKEYFLQYPNDISILSLGDHKSKADAKQYALSMLRGKPLMKGAKIFPKESE